MPNMCNGAVAKVKLTEMLHNTYRKSKEGWQKISPLRYCRATTSIGGAVFGTVLCPAQITSHLRVRCKCASHCRGNSDINSGEETPLRYINTTNLRTYTEVQQ